jgi:hypothetical protein
MNPEPGRHSEVRTRRLTRADVGAWLFRCNPRNIDMAELRRAGGVDSRCAVRTYRLDLIRAGDPVALWVTGPSKATITAGIWMLGYATGEIEGREISGATASELPRVLLRDMTPLPAPVPRSELASHPPTLGMEVLRQPFGPNPSYLTNREHRAVTALVGTWGAGDRRRPETLA